MDWHEKTIQEIGSYCEQKFGKVNVSIDTSDEKNKSGKNSLPILKDSNSRRDNLYFPDIIIKNKEKSITHIIEIVETSPGTPVSVFGVIFAADISISIMKDEDTQVPNVKPKLFFLIRDPKDFFDTYYCSICRDKHKSTNKEHFKWMQKSNLEINTIFNEATKWDKKFLCPICKKNHRIVHNHFSWFISRSSEKEYNEQIKRENKMTRLFEKTINNDQIKINVNNIELPKFCYETDYKSLI